MPTANDVSCAGNLDTHYRLLCRIARGLATSRHLRYEDIVGDVFIAGDKLLKTYDPKHGCSVEGYLLKYCGRNAIQVHMRERGDYRINHHARGPDGKRRCTRRRVIAPVGGDHGVGPNVAAATEQPVDTERHAAVLAAIKRLPPKLRRAFGVYRRTGDYAKVGKALGAGPERGRQLVREAEARLRELLGVDHGPVGRIGPAAPAVGRLAA